MKEAIKEKKIAILKAMMVYKVQLKINKNLDKKLLGKMRNLMRDLAVGKTDIDEKLAKIQAIVFSKNEGKMENNEPNENTKQIEEKNE